MSPEEIDLIAKSIAKQMTAGEQFLRGLTPDGRFQPFIYERTINFAAAAAAGTTAPDTLQFDAGSDFYCLSIKAGSRILSGAAATNGTVPAMDVQSAGSTGWADAPFLVDLRYGSSDRLFSNQPIDAALAFGAHGSNTGYVLPRPIRFEAASTLSITLTILRQATAGLQFSCRLEFQGVKVFRAAA